MGQEIQTTQFSQNDEKEYRQKLRTETNILRRWFKEKIFSSAPPKCGLELEAWLVTNDFYPAPSAVEFLEDLNNPLVVPEISKFNFELNTDPFDLKNDVFFTLENEIKEIWSRCSKTADALKLKPIMIGTLPTLRDHMLTMDNLSPQNRYFALNNQIMNMRDQKPIIIDVEGRDWVHVEHDNVITECAATSLQIHFGVTQQNAAKYYNSSVIASSFMAAVGANSPYLYGKELWEESRIPIFEQSINLRSFRTLNGDQSTRVSLGNGYVKNSIFELFLENLDGHPILLPNCLDSDPEFLDHLRLHNGTIWRWNRPLIGLNSDGTPSLRMEFRIPSAGPTIADAIANMVFQIAIVEALSEIDDLEKRIPFKVAKENFYRACKHGLNSEITWLDGKNTNIQKLLHENLLPKARAALKKYHIQEQDIVRYIDNIIIPRVKSGQNGAHWQKAFVHTRGSRFQEMLEVYYKNQQQNIPVHQWS